MSRRERKKEETRQRILDAAMVLFQRQGFDAVTMERIAEEADIAKATLYSYFPVKEALLVGWMQRLTAELRPDVEALLRGQAGTRARLKRLLVLFGRIAQERRALIERYALFRISSRERFCGDPTLRSGIDGILTRILSEGQQRGEVRNDVSPEELTNHLESLSLSALMMWLAAADDGGQGPRLEKIVDLFFDGIGGQ